MSFKRLSRNSKQLLDEIMAADNPADMLAKRFDGLTNSEDGIYYEARQLLQRPLHLSGRARQELRQMGEFSHQRGGNKP